MSDTERDGATRGARGAKKPRRSSRDSAADDSPESEGGCHQGDRDWVRDKEKILIAVAGIGVSAMGFLIIKWISECALSDISPDGNLTLLIGILSVLGWSQTLKGRPFCHQLLVGLIIIEAVLGILIFFNARQDIESIALGYYDRKFGTFISRVGYTSGEFPSIKLKVAKDCHVRIIYHDYEGNSTILKTIEIPVSSCEPVEKIYPDPTPHKDFADGSEDAENYWFEILNETEKEIEECIVIQVSDEPFTKASGEASLERLLASGIETSRIPFEDFLEDRMPLKGIVVERAFPIVVFPKTQTP